MDKFFLSTIVYKSDQIENKREKVREDLLKKSKNIKCGKITKISPNDIKLIFELYDEYFFCDYFKNNFNGSLDFSLSKRMTRSAGATVKYKNLKQPDALEKYEIKIGINFFFKFDELSRDKMVNGIAVKDSLDALLLVMEHELCHLIEFHIFGKSNCSGKRFKQLSKNLFEHKGIYHQLPTNVEIAGEKYGFKIGDLVCFENEGKSMNGIINRINTRATVMVQDKNGQYADSRGNRYTKWYVPLKELQLKSKGKHISSIK